LYLAVTFISAAGQSFHSATDIAIVYSQNDKFYLKTMPFDGESPSLRGRTDVYEAGREQPAYLIERGFALVRVAARP
jgi:hypothetical protein